MLITFTQVGTTPLIVDSIQVFSVHYLCKVFSRWSAVHQRDVCCTGYNFIDKTVKKKGFI